MNAWDVRERSIECQYEKVMDEIKKAMKQGKKNTRVGIGLGALYPEVAMKLVKEDGFDVEITLKTNDFDSKNLVSWESTEKGKEGNYVLIDERKPEPVKDFVIEIWVEEGKAFRVAELLESMPEGKICSRTKP